MLAAALPYICMIAWINENWHQLLGPFTTLWGILVATKTVIWQLGRQHESSLDIQRENKREELKLRVYETLIQRMEKAQDCISKAWMYVFVLPGNIELQMRNVAAGFQPIPLNQRGPKFAELHNAV